MARDEAVASRTLTPKERIGLLIHRNLDRWLSPLGVWVFRRTRGAIAHPFKVDELLPTTRGRSSGRSRTVVLQYFPDGEAIVVAAANDGGRSHSGWYHNLMADPVAHVEVAGRPAAMRAKELQGEEAAAWWQRIVRRDPTYRRYTRATDRRIPIVRLVPT